MIRTRKPWFSLLFAVALLVAALPVSAGPPADQPTLTPRLPLSFEANRGQFDPAVRFVARQGAHTFFFTPQEMAAVLSRGRPAVQHGLPGSEHLALKVRFLGASTAAMPAGEGMLPGKVNYIRGSDPAGWHLEVPTYRRILYRDLYPHTDLRYREAAGSLKYDFILRPGADPSRIALAYDGVEGLAVDARGQLEVRTAWGTLSEAAPRAWQETAGGGREPVAASYRLLVGDRVGFQVGSYDPDRPLILDPTLNYSTYLGGREKDYLHGLAADDAGNVLVTGSTQSANFPTTPGVYDEEYNTGWDVFVTKLAADGGSLLFSTFVGGSGNEVGYGLALDGDGRIVVSGATSSTDFPTTPDAHDDTHNGGKYDAFVLALAADGTDLLSSTYLGGSADDLAYALVLDGDEPVVSGATASSNFPTTTNAYDRFHNGLEDAFVTKLSAAADSLRFSTFAGGKESDSGLGVAVDSSGNVVVTGDTSSPGFPTTSGAFDLDHNGKQDAFVLALDPSGRSLRYSTFLGGGGNDVGHGLTLDADDNPVVAGESGSRNFPVTSGAYDETHNGSEDVFVLSLAADGGSLQFSTFLGGGDTDVATAIVLDSRGNPVVAGHSASTNYPTTPDAYAAAVSGALDAILFKLDPAGSSLLYSTCFGGSAMEEARALDLTGGGAAILGGWTESDDLPTTEGAYSPDYNYQADGFVVRFDGVGDPPPQKFGTAVSQSSDDAVEVLADGSMDLDSPEIRLLDDPGTHSAGFRFQNVLVPRQAEVVRAYVEFTAADTDSKTTSLTFHGQAGDDAGTFTPAAGDITTRTKTVAAVDWPEVPRWNQVHSRYRSPDLSPVVQEIVDRPGWASGNSLALIVTGSGKRELVTYDGDPDLAPRLQIEYEGEPAACYSLALEVEPQGGGTVDADPAPNCEGKYTAGTRVKLTAQPAAGYLFRSWSGDLSGSANPIELAMDGDRKVTALFRDEDQPLFPIYLPLALKGAP